MRNFYPEFIVGGVTSTWYVTGTRPKCSWATGKRVTFLASSALGGSISLIFHPKTEEAFRALSVVFNAHSYEFRETAGGSVSCRKITGGTKTTLHAHGVAMDINPSKNRYSTSRGLIQWGRQTDMSKQMIADVEAIRTNNGKPVFEWGGRWYNIKDAMHFQVSKCSPNDLATGINWSTVNGEQGEVDDMALKRGDKGNAVTKFQKALMAWDSRALPNFGADGDFGGETEEWVKHYQFAANVSQTGVIDGVTAALLTDYWGGDAKHIDLSAYLTAADANATFIKKGDTLSVVVNK